MPMNCFRSARSDSNQLDASVAVAPRPAIIGRPKKASFRRNGTTTTTSTTSSRTNSNASIAQLPPCPRLSDPKLEAMMMPVPPDPRPSRCLRLSHPRIYGNLVSDMKHTKGCRDWRNFAVFDADDIDTNLSAIEYGKKKALDCDRRLEALSRLSINDHSDKLNGVDMIG